MRLRRRVARHALRRRRDDVRGGRERALRDRHLRARSRAPGATAELARQLGLDERDHRGRRRHELRHLPDHGRPGAGAVRGHVVGLPVQTPWVDVRSIGAGGGSIAYVDAGGLLRVGPQSAGAGPGPACYGRGGTEPTVTDAAVVLGMLPASLAGGVGLSRDRAEAALAPLAERLGFESAADVARGILHIATAAMADAIREITVEQGRDPREAALVAFGGAGPLFGTLLARRARGRHDRDPALAGNFSAWGLLGADLTQTASRTRLMRLGDGAVAEVDALAAELFDELESRTARARGCDARCTSTCATSARSTRSRSRRRARRAASPRTPRPSARSSSASTSARSATRWTRSSRSSRCGRSHACRASCAGRRAAGRAAGCARRRTVEAWSFAPGRAGAVRARRARQPAPGRHARRPGDRARGDRDDLPRRRASSRERATRPAP